MRRLEEAIDLWIDITGINPNNNTISLNDFDIHKINSEIRESLELENDSILPYLIIREGIEKYIKDKSFSVSELIQDRKSIDDYISKCNTLIEIVNSDYVETRENKYKEVFKNIVYRLGFDSFGLNEFIDDGLKVGRIRRDALKSMSILKEHQFVRGKYSESNLQYSDKIYVFNNINDAIAVMAREDDFNGITLCYIQDEESELESYFAFIVKNGENIYAITDKPEYSHPNQKNMMRCKGRDYHNRIGENYFPYYLNNVEYNRYGEVGKKENKGNTKEVVYGLRNLSYIGKISLLSPENVVWIISMFSLIEDRYFRNKVELELSYTAAMIKRPNLLKESVSLEAYSNYKQLNLSNVSVGDFCGEYFESLFDSESSYRNEWIVKKYGSRIDESLINVDCDDNSIKYYDGDSVKSMSISKYDDLWHSEQDKISAVKCCVMQHGEFGTKEYLRRNQLLTARYNLTRKLNQLLEEDYEENYQTIMSWYRASVEKNISKVFLGIANGVYLLPNLPVDMSDIGKSLYKEGKSISDNYEECFIYPDNYDRFKNALEFIDYKDYDYSLRRESKIRLNGVKDDKEVCYITNSKPYAVVRIKVNNVAAIAGVCGCRISELPDFLRHWKSDRWYGGNSILNCLDPLDWAIKNSWYDTPMNVDIILSKSGYNKIRKQFGLPPKQLLLNNK